MKISFLIPFLLSVSIALVSCAQFDNLLKVTDTTLSVPQARVELVNYLTPDQKSLIADDLALLDKTFQPIQNAVEGNSDLSLEGALQQALGAAANSYRLEAAFLNIRAQVRKNKTDDNPVPSTLARVSEDVESMWSQWDGVQESNRRAQLYLRILVNFVNPVPLSVSASVPIVA